MTLMVQSPLRLSNLHSQEVGTNQDRAVLPVCRQVNREPSTDEPLPQDQRRIDGQALSAEQGEATQLADRRLDAVA